MVNVPKGIVYFALILIIVNVKKPSGRRSSIWIEDSKKREGNIPDEHCCVNGEVGDIMVVMVENIWRLSNKILKEVREIVLQNLKDIGVYNKI